jgi:hypothetical protein
MKWQTNTARLMKDDRNDGCTKRKKLNRPARRKEIANKGAGIQDALWTALAAEILKAAMQ